MTTFSSLSTGPDRRASRRRRASAKVAAALSGALSVSTPVASAQEEADTESAEATPPESAITQQPETSAEEPGPSPVNETEEEKKSGPYSYKVRGKLWIEGFVGPSSYDPDRFGGASTSSGTLDTPREKGPEFGAAIGGAAIDHSYFISGMYRQANYGTYKLMKVGLGQQGVFRTPYVHPVLRVDLGYARIFDGSIYPILESPSQGFFFMFGFGIRVPIIRWISFLATFDWTYVALFGSSDEFSVIHGSQVGGTFALTFHFFGVDSK